MTSRNFRALANYRAKLADRITNLNPVLAQDLRAIKLPWYLIRNADEGSTQDSDTSEVFIYDEIGGSFGISADEFVKDLQNIKSKKIDVRINSPGGSVFDAVAIYNSLIKHPATVTTYVDALAASAASIIAMAGDECVMMIGSQLMIHDALGAEMGNAKAMRAMADFLDQQTGNLATIYASKAGGDIDEWLKLMYAETWMFAQEAVDFGLADSVYVRPKAMPMEEETEEEPEEDLDDTEAEEIEAEEDEESTEDDEIAAIMAYRHRLTNRGFKYTGRRDRRYDHVNNAIHRDVDKLLANWR